MQDTVAVPLVQALADSVRDGHTASAIAGRSKWIALWAAMLCAHLCLHATARLPARIGQRYMDVLFLLTLGWAVLVPYYESEVRGGRGSEALPVLSSLILFVVGRLSSAAAGHRNKVGWLEHFLGWGFLIYFYTGVMDPTERFMSQVTREGIRAFIGWELAALALISMSLAVKRTKKVHLSSAVCFYLACGVYAGAELLLTVQQVRAGNDHNPAWMYPWFAGLKFLLAGLFVGCMGSESLGGAFKTLTVLAAFLEEERPTSSERAAPPATPADGPH